MAAVIRQDQFDQCFEFIVGLWPATLQVSKEDIPRITHTNHLINHQLKHNLEHLDYSLARALQTSVFIFLCDQLKDPNVERITRTCIDKTKVRAIFDRYPAFSVAG